MYAYFAEYTQTCRRTSKEWSRFYKNADIVLHYMSCMNVMYECHEGMYTITL